MFLGQYGQGPLDDNSANNKDDLNQKDAVFYATFSTAPNAIGGSAVCAFRLRTVSDAFAGKNNFYEILQNTKICEFFGTHA